MLLIFREVVSVFSFRDYDFSEKLRVLNVSGKLYFGRLSYSVFRITFRQIVPVFEFRVFFRKNACSPR